VIADPLSGDAIQGHPSTHPAPKHNPLGIAFDALLVALFFEPFERGFIEAPLWPFAELVLPPTVTLQLVMQLLGCSANISVSRSSNSFSTDGDIDPPDVVALVDWHSRSFVLSVAALTSSSDTRHPPMR
jgi:hypothetical protein